MLERYGVESEACPRFLLHQVEATVYLSPPSALGYELRARIFFGLFSPFEGTGEAATFF